MINCQKLNFLLFLTINSVTIGVRELNGTSQISLVTHDARGLDEVSSGLARMGESCFNFKAPPIICSRRQFQFCRFIKITNKA